MSSMNAMGHVLVAMAGGIDSIWDLMEEMNQRLEHRGGVGVHSIGKEGVERYCVHPNSEKGIEFRNDDLEAALTVGAMWLAAQFPDEQTWSRE